MTIAAIPAILSGLGTVVSTFAQFQQAKYQASVAKMNAKINEQNAERAAFAGQVEAQDQSLRNRAIIGEEISKQAGSGLSLGSRSFALQRKNLTELSRQDAARLAQQGQVDAFNFRVSAANDRAQAGLFKSQATGALVGGAFGLASDVISSPFGSSLVSGALTTRKQPQFAGPKQFARKG